MFLNFEFPETGVAAHNLLRKLAYEADNNLSMYQNHTTQRESLPRTQMYSVTQSGKTVELVLRTYEDNPEKDYLQLRYKGPRDKNYGDIGHSVGMLGLFESLNLPEPWVYHPDVGDPAGIPWNQTLLQYFKSDLADPEFALKYLYAEIEAKRCIVSAEGVIAYARLPSMARDSIDNIVSGYNLIANSKAEINPYLTLGPYVEPDHDAELDEALFGIRPTLVG